MYRRGKDKSAIGSDVVRLSNVLIYFNTYRKCIYYNMRYNIYYTRLSYVPSYMVVVYLHILRWKPYTRYIVLISNVLLLNSVRYQ